MDAKITKEPLSHSVVKGGLWVFLLQIVQQLFNICKLIIIARILDPHDFGLMGIALLAMATLETFSQTGFQVALIQKKGNIEAYLDSVWTVEIVRGIILFAILYFIAPYVAIFFKTPEAKSIIQIIGFTILLGAFTSALFVIGGGYMAYRFNLLESVIRSVAYQKEDWPSSGLPETASPDNPTTLPARVPKSG